MSDQVSMMLGPFAFEGIGFGYEGVGRRVDTPWADIAVSQSLNQQQWTGPTSEDVTIKGVLFPEEFGGQASLDGVIASANAGAILMLISGDALQGIIHGLYTVQGVDEDRSYHTMHGSARRNVYSISLRRYAGVGFGGSLMSSVISILG